MESKRIVEIKGIKMEVDYREGTAVKVESFKVGSKVKLLTKGYSDYTVRPGVIIGFDEFKALPTIKVLVVNDGYAGGVEFVSFNEGLKDAELISADDDEELLAKKDAVVEQLTRAVASKTLELDAAKESLRIFERYYGKAVEQTAVNAD